jgi:hypothetical protein
VRAKISKSIKQSSIVVILYHVFSPTITLFAPGATWIKEIYYLNPHQTCFARLRYLPCSVFFHPQINGKFIPWFSLNIKSVSLSAVCQLEREGGCCYVMSVTYKAGMLSWNPASVFSNLESAAASSSRFCMWLRPFLAAPYYIP